MVVSLTDGWGRSKAQDQSGSSYDDVAMGGGTRGGGRTLHKNGDSRSRKMEINTRHVSKSNQWDFGEYRLQILTKSGRNKRERNQRRPRGSKSGFLKEWLVNIGR